MKKGTRWQNLADLEAASKALSKRTHHAVTGDWAADLKRLLLKKVRKNKNGCWVWQGAIATWGYGVFNFAWGAIPAHKAAFLLFKGDLPKDKPFVCHACDNPPCVNPAHLWAGDAGDNIRDAVRKGRAAHNFKGEGNNGAILKNEDILRIRAAKKAATKIHKMHWGAAKIARELGVNRHHVMDIGMGRHWEHLK